MSFLHDVRRLGVTLLFGLSPLAFATAVGLSAWAAGVVDLALNPARDARTAS